MNYHRTQRRKGTPAPYLIHPIEAGYFLALFYPNQRDLVIAGYLHDLIEDTDADHTLIKLAFNERVADLVESVSAEWKGDWTEMRERQVQKLRDHADIDFVRLKAADMLSNATSIARDSRIFGEEETFKKFKAGKEKVLWYYWSAVEAIRDRLKGEPIVVELEYQVRSFTGRDDTNVEEESNA